MKKHLVFIGPPACGKGTQSAILQKEGLYAIATGDAIRKEIDTKSTIGLELKKIIDQGRYISDELICEMIAKKVKTTIADEKTIIFDGFPRTTIQAEFLVELLESCYNNKPIYEILEVIHFDISENILLKRIVNRYSCSDCKAIYNTIIEPTKKVCDICKGKNFIKRSDDNEKTALIRLDVYNKKTIPVLNFFQQKNILRVIKADNKSIEDITKELHV